MFKERPGIRVDQGGAKTWERSEGWMEAAKACSWPLQAAAGTLHSQRFTWLRVLSGLCKSALDNCRTEQLVNRRGLGSRHQRTLRARPTTEDTQLCLCAHWCERDLVVRFDSNWPASNDHLSSTILYTIFIFYPFGRCPLHAGK